MLLEELRSKRIAILGYGQEGQAVFAYLKKHGMNADVLDKQSDGEGYLQNLHEFDVVFRSPGIWRKHEQILEAEKLGTVITSQAKFFFENCPAKIIGVTGTKGKGTTSSLVYEMLKKSEIPVFLTGNIGKTQPLEFIDDLTEKDFVVYEMSSFQLQDLQISPHIGVCLMITADHLDHHADLAEYHASKSAIVEFQTENDFAIFNIDYPPSKEIGQKSKGQKLEISSIAEPVKGIFIDKEKNAIKIISDPSSTKLIDCTDRKLRGVHNLENIAAATLAAICAGAPLNVIESSIKEFAGLEHRLQFLGTFNGVSYYNDSISTVPETTLAAVRSFAEPIHLFLGGSDKGLSYASLITELNNIKNIASITLLGETGAFIKTELEKQQSHIPFFGPYTDFNKAVTETTARAKSGEVVLLSPASASFDMFENYAQRGKIFGELINQLANNG